jgi:hypothetical protein
MWICSLICNPDNMWIFSPDFNTKQWKIIKFYNIELLQSKHLAKDHQRNGNTLYISSLQRIYAIS